MQFIRKTLVGLAATLLTATLFGLGFTWSLQHVFGTSHDIKAALRDSKFYDVVVGSALDEAQKKQDQPAGKGDIPVSQPAIRAIIKQAFPPTLLQAQTEQVLDSIYTWLHSDGTTPLSFTIDLTSAKAQLAEGVGSYVQQRLAGLPVCTPGALPSGDVDAFTATCVPSGYNVASAAAQARDQILHGDFLKDSKISSSTFKNNNGGTIDQQLRKVPGTYHHVQQAMTGAMVLAVLLGIGIVFMSITWRRGVRRLGIVLLSVGAVNVVLAFVLSMVVHRIGQEMLKHHTDQPLQQKAFDVAQLLANDVRQWWLLYGIGLIVLGVAGIVLIRFVLKPPHGQEIGAHAPSPAPQTVDEPANDEAGKTPASDVTADTAEAPIKSSKKKSVQ